MIQLTDISGRTHAIHPDAIARLVEVVALLITSGFGMFSAAIDAGRAASNMLSICMFVAIYFVCRRVLVGR